MKAHIVIAICTACVFLGQSGVNALECYVCNSHEDTRCARPVPPDELLRSCDNLGPGGTKYTMCRKTVQSIEFGVNGLVPETRVIRTCGYDESNYKGRCYQRGGFGGRQEVCSCLTDKCNGATTIMNKSAHFILMFLCVVATAYRSFVGN
ncbi:uncharacterized protein [Fopius arisanus]|uniref:Aat protein n=1 Tax=Fopius arisanus TaxID=64838 RepID=A0A0C9Q2S4_9HYME|nr:PREDICTED: uncharacterized protein LOC105273772 [Fopius arisanus]